MKKYTVVLFLSLVFTLSTSAQEQPVSETALVRSRYYEVTAGEAGLGVEALAAELEQRFAVYNRLFRFDPGIIKTPLKVRLFKSEEAYNAYVSARLGASRPGAVYLHYNQSDKRELILHRESPDEERVFPYQAFIQYIRAFIPNPPAWIREGFAIYFSALRFSEKTGGLTYEENLSWLEPVKNLGASAPPLKAVLMADVDGAPPNMESLSWALVSFFLNNGNEDYFRTLIESFMVLSPPATAADNTEAVMRRMSLWTDFDSLEKDYKAYIGSRKTFAEFLEDGQKFYAAKDPAAAELSFLGALDQKPNHFAPYYYLGLLAYEEKNYAMAEHYYRSALQYGADGALISYALGINAASAGRSQEAINFLREAAAASPERYKERAENLISRLSD
jgi:tetratricopeptide (TPR) repeat protein